MADDSVHDLESVFEKLIELEKNSVRGIKLDKSTGIFDYMNNMPIYTRNINLIKKMSSGANSDICSNNDVCLLYSIPRIGDLVTNIRVHGVFKSAMLYQYDWTGSIKIIYDSFSDVSASDDSVCDANMNPFPTSGYPLLPSGKALYLEVSDGVCLNDDDDDDNGDINVSVEYVFLDDESRRELVNYREGDSDHGVKVVHSNGTIYQVLNMSDCGYSPNVLGPVEN